MDVLPFKAEDFQELFVQPAQAEWNTAIGDVSYAEELAKGGYCFSARANGILCACIGLINHWPGRRYAWAFLAADLEQQMIPLHRSVARWLRYRGEGRIETAIDPTHTAAIRWAEMLGFEREGLMKRYAQDGRDCYLYARVQ